MSPEHNYKLYLYIAGYVAQGMDLAERNIRDCLDAISGRDYALEVIEVVKNPQAAIEEGILFTPTLLRISPGPKKRVVGNFLDKVKILEALKLIQMPS
jgi:circadian clock protein KaiB